MGEHYARIIDGAQQRDRRRVARAGTATVLRSINVAPLPGAQLRA
jgi:hypothetical protein